MRLSYVCHFACLSHASIVSKTATHQIAQITLHDRAYSLYSPRGQFPHSILVRQARHARYPCDMSRQPCEDITRKLYEDAIYEETASVKFQLMLVADGSLTGHVDSAGCPPGECL